MTCSDSPVHYVEILDRFSNRLFSKLIVCLAASFVCAQIELGAGSISVLIFTLITRAIKGSLSRFPFTDSST